MTVVLVTAVLASLAVVGAIEKPIAFVLLQHRAEFVSGSSTQGNAVGHELANSSGAHSDVDAWQLTSSVGEWHNVREYPSLDAPVIGKKYRGDVVHGTKKKGGHWLKLSDEPGYCLTDKDGDVFIGKVRSVLDIGDEVKALPGAAFEGHYKEGDIGVVSSVSEDSYSITWKATGKTSSIASETWMEKFQHTGSAYRQKLDMGFEVKVLAGKSMEGTYDAGDIGIVTGITEDTYWITWKRSGATSTCSQRGWMELYEMTGLKYKSHLTVGDEVQALAGKSFEGYYTEGDVGVVSTVTDDKYFITWRHCGGTSSIPKRTWMKTFHSTGQVYQKKLKVGFEVKALPGKFLDGFYKEGDVGTITAVTDDDYTITWKRTGASSSCSRTGWMERFEMSGDAVVSHIGGKKEDARDASMRASGKVSGWRRVFQWFRGLGGNKREANVVTEDGRMEISTLKKGWYGVEITG